VRSLGVLIPGGGRVAWSAQGDRIAFDREGEDGRRDLWVARPDGSGETCLTCTVYDLGKASSFNPVWHPSGQFLVFQVQSLPKKLGMGPAELATPLRAAHSELWMIPLEGRRAWQLTRVGERGGGIADPDVSHEAGQLLWSERLRSQPGPWGDWVVRVARLEIGRGVPHLGKVKTLEPGTQRGLMLAQEFTPDDRGVLYAAGSGDSLGLLRLDMGSKKGPGEPVGPRPGARGWMARLLPGRPGLLWAASLGLTRRTAGQVLPYRSDLWLQGPDSGPGGGPAGRVTFFNDPASEHFLGEALVDDAAWSPEGDRFLAHVVHAGREGVREDVYLVVLDERYRR
jgi:hypothetical protein